MKITLVVNGHNKECEVMPSELLVDCLRRIGFHGVKKGCGEGNCGSCVVLLEGKPVNSCLIPAIRVEGMKITTIEGLGTRDQPHALQDAYVEHGAVQCGFCTPGSILSASALLSENPRPGIGDIKRALDGNLCRCTGYKKKIEAVLAAAETLSGK